MVLREAGEKCCRLRIVDIAHGNNLSSLILEHCAADNGAAAAKANHSNANPVIGSQPNDRKVIKNGSIVELRFHEACRPVKDLRHIVVGEPEADKQKAL